VAGAVALVRCARWRPTAGVHGAWLRDAARLAAALGAAGAVVGHHDEATLVMYAPLAAAAVARLLRREVGEPGLWFAGVVDARVGGHDPAQLLRMASALADAARVADHGAVRVHTARTAPVQPQVLLAEHDPLRAALLEGALRSAGVSFGTYATGAGALAALQARPAGGAPPLVLLDHELPGVDGHALYAWLCEHRALVRHVVCTSAVGQERDELRVLRAGAVDCVRAPLSAAVLAAKLPHWLTAG
jgi:CheY-like chemotaxis protein